ncbi:hypothetical protein HPG69_006832, partial [Diceros bicornis minor]
MKKLTLNKSILTDLREILCKWPLWLLKALSLSIRSMSLPQGFSVSPSSSQRKEWSQHFSPVGLLEVIYSIDPAKKVVLSFPACLLHETLNELGCTTSSSSVSLGMTPAQPRPCSTGRGDQPQDSQVFHLVTRTEHRPLTMEFGLRCVFLVAILRGNLWRTRDLDDFPDQDVFEFAGVHCVLVQLRPGESRRVCWPCYGLGFSGCGSADSTRVQ